MDVDISPKINVFWLSYNSDTPSRGYWDMGMLEDVFSNKMWYTGYDFVHHEVGAIPENIDGGVIVFPARAQIKYLDELNSDIARMKWVVLFLTGDEEASFPIEKIKHDNIKIWVMSPRQGRHDAYGRLGTGYPAHISEHLSVQPPAKDLDWFFSGQITHQRRIDCAKQLREMSNGKLIESEGFTQGVPPKDYYDFMSRAKIAPAPSGPETPDSFRLFEALECAAVPIADTRVIKENFPDDYWLWFFGEEPPFPILTDYEQLRGYIEDTINKYPVINNDVFSWWMGKKKEFVLTITDNIKEVSDITPANNDITVIVPASPIKSHPDTSIIDETIQSIRRWLPNAEIILTFDGVREEHESRREDYEEFIRRILWKCNRKYKNVTSLIFKEHTHQVGMAREALKLVNTDLIMYAEQDTPLVIDEDIDFKKCIDFIRSGEANLVRFHFEGVIPKEHEHMMIADVEDGFLRTSQWSQRPHLASKAYYERILKDNFTKNARCFIEDKMHGVVDQAFITGGLQGWYQHRIWIYYPDEKNIKRSYHTDGRAGEAKLDNTQIW